jgi:hypothetical protein
VVIFLKPIPCPLLPEGGFYFFLEKHMPVAGGAGSILYLGIFFHVSN